MELLEFLLEQTIMSVSKVIYFSFLPITEFVVKKYFIEELLKTSIKVEYLDLSRLFPHQGIEYVYEDKWGTVVSIDSYTCLSDYLDSQNQAETLYLSQITYNSEFLKLFHLFHKKKCKTGVLAVGLLPTQTGVMNKLKLRNFTFSKIRNFILNRSTSLMAMIKWVDYYSVVFKVGNVLLQRNYSRILINLAKADKVIDVNTTDYDFSLDIKALPRLIAEPYILYLDNYLPFHPDIAIIGLKSVDSDSFYRQLNCYFDALEKKYGQKVVIAAHPKAAKYREYNFFDGRKVIFGNTALLARDASLLLCHGSTTMGLATIYGKKVYFLTSKEIAENMPSTDSFLRISAAELGAPVVCFDAEQPYFPEHVIDNKKYEWYKYMYMTSENSEHKKTPEILAEALNNLNL